MRGPYIVTSRLARGQAVKAEVAARFLWLRQNSGGILRFIP
jgi:hypothetical protein